jgi:hypothetical protein
VGCDTPVISSDEAPGIAYVNERWRTDADVSRASDVFGGKEDHGSDVVFRTEASGPRRTLFLRQGWDEAPPADAKLVLQVVRAERFRRSAMSFRPASVRVSRSANTSSA